MTSSVTLGIKDYDGETSTFGLYVPTMTAANFDATITAIDAVVAAINGVLLQAISRRQTSAEDLPFGPKATDPYAQREAKWRVKFEDDVTPDGNGSFEMPAPDLTLLNPGQGTMNISAGAGLALVTAIEANLVSRLGNSITVTEILHVGRNI